jgi:endogenous inhibitor of DNA gyrase (YacG/DUF329 family)
MALHKVDLPAGASLTAKCVKCKATVTVAHNKTAHSTSLAFNHPNQQLFAPCPGCGEKVEWTPSDAKMVNAN